MNAQSKIIASIITGLAIGAGLIVLIYSMTKEETDYLQSGGSPNAGPAIADEWSDMNDSLGG